ncbi:hypothetical protein ZIOFF_010061 [Zingiber officinale]|uniref:DRBM domain-containing protein n=1 Tax=Zingiber officinale TaxID=94328 RepID=A0A8J5LJT0_ZINOF|nr:hypothetical protein ZIOFF_010061 [Zingiber officinale]
MIRFASNGIITYQDSYASGVSRELELCSLAPMVPILDVLGLLKGHKTGLCKNLLQEYAQKMNYAIPSYIHTKSSSGVTPYICTVEIGGIQYIGAAARTKKEAEIKAARTALLAIQSQSNAGYDGASHYAVLPGKRKVKELEVEAEVVKKIKTNKASFKKRWSKKRFHRNNDGQVAESHKDEPQIAVSEDESTIPGRGNDVQIQEPNHDP